MYLNGIDFIITQVRAIQLGTTSVTAERECGKWVKTSAEFQRRAEKKEFFCNFRQLCEKFEETNCLYIPTRTIFPRTYLLFTILIMIVVAAPTLVR